MKWSRPDGSGQRAFLRRTFKGHDVHVASPTRVPIEKIGDPPHDFIVGADGSLAASGAYKVSGGEIEGIVKRELGRLRKGWGEDPVERKARKLAYAREQFGKALNMLEGGEREAVRREIEDHLQRRLALVSQLLESGRYVEAIARIEAIERGGKGVQGLSDLMKAVRTRVETDDVQRWKKIDAQLLALRRKIVGGKPSMAVVKKLDAIATRCDCPPIASRATELARVARTLQ